ncbi:uncharacterized protein K452DRAFT_284824 [Aplosporella prunicola CBS 121167]|uniref:Fucose-specific lectin n=1 Tax=Aplosporella prunicola CBS 121167 TaxID=1176127 RepID=A0A6A6BPL6_9PEZI|nr:uncharacterized protein K452DRAFT_284824 [Aplosporella prunicola CBS 121167]KAF2144501.1 hypothetical protein K452DRAFT_284824 [Aplosporella prunicola CBS 121167]
MTPDHQDSLEYSNLEVNEAAQAPSEKARTSRFLEGEQNDEDDVGPLPEVPYSNLPEAKHTDFPEVVNTSLPEVIDSTPPETAPADRSPRKAAICGLRRRTFFIVLGVVALIVVAAIGGGVGGALGNGKSSSSSSESANADVSDPGSSSAGGDDGDDGNSTGSASLLASSRLAALNYTDEYNHTNYLVYFQANTSRLYQTAWNSSTADWTVRPVTGATDDVETGTPLSASIFWHRENYRDLRLYYLNRTHHIHGIISSDGGAHWKASGIVGQFEARASSRLASYGRECAACLTQNMLVYEDPAGALRVASPENGAWTAVPVDLPADVQLVNGTDMALAPVYTDEATKRVVLFVNGGKLVRLAWDGKSWSSETTPHTLAANASFAALSTGQNSSNSGGGTASTLSFSVFITSTNESDSDSANNTPITLLTNAYTSTTNNSAWHAGPVPALRAVHADTALAANQAGRAYAVAVADDEEGAPVVVQVSGFVDAGAEGVVVERVGVDVV